MNGAERNGHLRSGDQAGFSMIEMLMAAFIMAVGLLGLAMLLVMSVHSGAGGRLRTMGIAVGQSVLELVDTEGRQQRLFRTLDPADAAPALSAYYSTTTPVTRTYNIYGTAVNAASADPLERAAIYTATSTCSKDATGATATSGSVYTFRVVVTYTDSAGTGGGTTTHTQTFYRKVTL